MTDPIGTYTFLPWLRHGIANQIGADGAASARAHIKVDLKIEGPSLAGGTASNTVSRDVNLYGPGDVIGVDAAQISRMEPAHWTTNFEPNYFAAIEFYDEDFPWRYTPAAPVGRKLLPWITLIVLEDGTEFAEGAALPGRPLPWITLKADPADVFPAEGWAWAHAHFNAAFSDKVLEGDATLAATKASETIKATPDRACSRLLCARKLKPKTRYHAFLIPSFESGRLAGLGMDPAPLFADTANALTPTSSAWGAYGTPANRPEPATLPFYHRWYFQTAEQGDFESLVRLLKPRVVDARVGHRDMDVTDPAPNVTGILDAKFHGILRLGGALKAPIEVFDAHQQDEFNKYDQWATPYPHLFQQQLAAFLNLSASYQVEGVDTAHQNSVLNQVVQNDPDPMITPPIYGRWHALTDRLLTKPDGTPADRNANWVHDLNLDPRWRVAAGFATGVIQTNQETYMNAAWDQIGDVLEANRRIRLAQLAKHAGRRVHERHLKALAAVSPAAVMMWHAPVSARIISGGITVRHQMRQSPIGVSLTSSAMRRAVRPRGKLETKLGLGTDRPAWKLLDRVNLGTLVMAPPKLPPDKALSLDDLASAVAGPPLDGLAGVLDGFVGNDAWKLWLVGLILVVILLPLLLLGPFGWLPAAVLVRVMWTTWQDYRRAVARRAVGQSLGEAAQTPAAVGAIPASSSFILVDAVDPRNPSMTPIPAPQPGSDSVEAGRFKTALSDQYRVIETSRTIAEVPPKRPLNITKVATDIVKGLDPVMTVPRWTLAGLELPPRVVEQVEERFVEAMAYPEFDIPMYEPLAKAGAQYFVPNIHLVEPNSVTLLETNQKFIEAYMVGLNHEFARELLWREYPTDQRGSCFRQFWDVRKKIEQAADKAAAREQLKDIKPLDHWSQASDLGNHDNREAGTVAEEELVLVIRGELLKKYPNTVISAHPAKWQLDGNGEPDKAKERQLDESRQPIFPLYEARVEPDIYFFGFDLTVLVARGDNTVDDKPGWFFRIEEVPGDARFGFDIERETGTQINVWNDLAWPDVAPGLDDGKPVKVADIPSRTLIEPTAPSLAEKKTQWQADKDVPLDASLSAAEIAYIALQTPVIMAVHASELLPE